MFDRDGRVLVARIAARSRFRSCASTRKISTARFACCREVAGLDRSRCRPKSNRHKREPTYQPIVVVDDASLAQVAAVLARRLDTELPDVVVEEVPTRRYPTDELAAHLFGYVGEASEGEVANDGLQSGAIVGQVGRRERSTTSC